MVGRTFIPDEDMGEFTAHVDTPQGTSLEGTRGDRRSRWSKEIGGLEGVARVAYLAGADRVNHFHVFFYLKPRDERDVTQDAGHRRASARSWPAHPGLAPVVTAQNPLGGGGGGNFAIQASLLGPGHRRSCTTTRSSCSRRRSRRRAWSTPRPTYSNASPEVHVVGRSRARRRSRRPHVDRRQHAAADGGGRRRDLDLSATAASSIR